MGMECGVTTPSGSTQSRALRLGNNKREDLRRARSRHEAYSSLPHTHTHTPTATHFSPTPPSCADLLESAVVVGGLPPSEEVHRLPPSRASPPSLLSFLAPSLPRCRSAAGGSCDDMWSVKRVHGKSDYRPPHSRSNESFLFSLHSTQKNPSLKSCRHPPRDRLDGVPVQPSTPGWYVCIPLCLVWVWLSSAAVTMRLFLLLAQVHISIVFSAVLASDLWLINSLL